jgi:hypothetical protein
MRIFKRVLKVVGGLLVALAVALGLFVYVECSKFDASMDKVYDVPIANVTRSSDPAVVARGKHLVESLAGCGTGDCHSPDLGGAQRAVEMGPLGAFSAPNISPGGIAVAYSDGELARLILHGIKKDGRSVRFMPVQDIAWLPDADVQAIVSYLRTVPASDRANGITNFTALAKVLDRNDEVVIDVARRIDHGKHETAPAPAPTADYGRFLGRLCTGCHGDHYSGGRIPGAPDSIPVPLNITLDSTGLAGWSFQDFDTVMRTGRRKNGKQLDPFMDVNAWKNLDDTEMHALWAFLQTLPATPFGKR